MTPNRNQEALYKTIDEQKEEIRLLRDQARALVLELMSEWEKRHRLTKELEEAKGEEDRGGI